jgi:hypothetical protein
VDETAAACLCIARLAWMPASAAVRVGRFGRSRDLGHVHVFHERLVLVVRESSIGLILAHDLDSWFRW